MKRFKLFPGIVFLLLGVNATIVGITVYLANSDRSFAVEPDYYQKALRWDAQVQQREQTLALGWDVRLDPGAQGAAGRHVQISIRDRDGRPVEGARVRVTAFPAARAADRFGAEFDPSEPGVYRADMDLAQPGLWEFDVLATRGGDQYTNRLRVSVQGRAL